MAAITVTDLTSGDLAGTGVFDQLMRATKAHLAEEYSKGRIKGGEYATVYLGAMQSVMSQSLQFLLQEQRTDLEAQLLQEQIQNQKKEGFQIEAQTALLDQQTANAIIEGTVLTAQECKIRAEYDVLMEQKLKTVGETALLAQKKSTEKAQIDGTGIGPNSVIDKQNKLYSAQTSGYIRDAEQKAAKLLVDTWNVRKTMDDTTLADYRNNLSDDHIGVAIERLMTGIDAEMPVETTTV